ncbi:nicotinate-nucleotide adenylyltransferase [Tropicibacter oceani]|uniref:Probable nicotinate-nucleotide adenylyltransferase n=1 Tax=Tropicibacter oceani TaxID=3058420 RepID=A0ABY8QHG7_9RHOB|nr:nicotinate-nucleotide adenylyltransferase [Tropicibacter oceani]WGW04094.1 nicotinate-nucleotide adenylyltransferase [Tropicibacter oceani]
MRADDGVLLTPGMRVGLLGGSFDPPHAGHLHLSKEALKRFGLDRVLWLVSPGNPLKADAPARLEKRLAAARALVDHPAILVSDFETRAGTRHTARTISAMQAHWPGVRFVWLMGADNLAQFHRWQDWQDIMRRVPVGVLARPEARLAARGSVAAQVFSHHRLSGRAARLLGRADAPRWCFINIPMMPHSSSAIRASGGWTR